MSRFKFAVSVTDPLFLWKLECMCENPKNFACGAPPGGLAAPLSLDAVRKILRHGALRHRKDAGQNLAYPPTNRGARGAERHSESTRRRQSTRAEH